MSKDLKITFQPSGRTVHVLPGTSIYEAAAEAGIIIKSPCGAVGKCGKCLVRVEHLKNDAVTESEKSHLTPEQFRHGFRLACEHKLTSNAVIEIPDDSLFESGTKILAEQNGATCSPDAYPPGTYGLCFDIGTTTLVGSLIELHSGREMAVVSAVNPQTIFGDDVISRIKKCRDEEAGLSQLNKVIIDAINKLISELCTKTAVSASLVSKAVFSGNTVMQQIFCGMSVNELGEIPFKPAFTEPQHFSARKIGLDLTPDTRIQVFPQIGGFVGGDTVAGITVTRIASHSGPSLFVDIGTNGEIALANKGRIMAASVAAGPAFEGARIVNGMRGAKGAIEKISFENDLLQINVIGNVKPIGICGSGLIDAVALMLSYGILDPTGLILSPGELPATTPEALKDRIVENNGNYDFIIAKGAESKTGKDIVLTQRDIREVQLAKGALSAGINILLKMNGLSVSDLEVIYLAGAFGNYIRRENACRMGLLPQIPMERIKFVGNTSLAGARLALLSKAQFNYASECSDMTEHVDLSSYGEFQTELSDAMLFPDAK